MIINEKNRHAWYVAVVLCALSMIFMWWLYAVSIAPSWTIFLVLAWVYGIVAVVGSAVMAIWVINWNTSKIDTGPFLPVVIASLMTFAIVLIIAFLFQITFS